MYIYEGKLYFDITLRLRYVFSIKYYIITKKIINLSIKWLYIKPNAFFLKF